MKSSNATKLQAVADMADALNLEGVTVHMDLHKAAKGETIRAPHLNPVIWEIEQEFYDLWDSKGIVEEVLGGLGISANLFGMKKAKKTSLYRTDGEPLSNDEMKRLETIIATALKIDRSKVNELVLKSAAAAKVASQEMMGQRVKVDISMLPTTLQAAIKELRLNPIEVNAIRYAFQYAAMNITNISQIAQTKIQRMVVEAIQNRMSPKHLASKMFDELAVNDNSVLNRDWERIAITETNRSANDGFIASQMDGDYVVGDSHDDACVYCKRLINLKVYRVTTDPPPDYRGLKPGTKKYEEIAHRWDTEIWVGKSNIGRGLAARKQQGGKLVDREHHEQGMPTLPLHPHCRCRWSEWIPDLYYIKGGRVEFAVDDVTEKEQQEWLKGHPHIKIGE